MKITVEAAKVFTGDLRKGNLAGVVLDATSLSDQAMQAIATAVNASETAFILPSERADLRIRWFTPKNEVGICVHATIAALARWANAHNDHRRSFLIETRNAVLSVEREGPIIHVNIPGYNVEKRELNEARLLELFDISIADLASSIGVIRIYEDHELILQLKSLRALESLKPETSRYAEICRAADVTGLCLFARESYSSQHDIHMREFAPLYGYLEDPLCGMASGCVLTYLRDSGLDVRTMKVEQGHFCLTAGTIFVRHEQQSGIWIGGECIFGKPLELMV